MIQKKANRVQKIEKFYYMCKKLPGIPRYIYFCYNIPNWMVDKISDLEYSETNKNRDWCLREMIGWRSFCLRWVYGFVWSPVSSGGRGLLSLWSLEAASFWFPGGRGLCSWRHRSWSSWDGFSSSGIGFRVVSVGAILGRIHSLIDPGFLQNSEHSECILSVIYTLSYTYTLRYNTLPEYTRN